MRRMRKISMLMLSLVVSQLANASGNACLFEHLEQIAPFECSERNANLLAIQISQMRTQLRETYHKKTAQEQQNLQKDLATYTEHLNILRGCQAQLGQRQFSCALFFSTREPFTASFYLSTDAIAVRDSIDESQREVCKVEVPTRGISKTIETADGTQLIQGLGQYWNLDHSPTCPKENLVYPTPSRRVSRARIAGYRTQIEQRLENNERRFVFSMRTSEFPNALDSFGMIDWSNATDYDSSFKVSTHIKRRIEFHGPSSSATSEIVEVDGNLRLSWRGGAYLDISPDGEIIDSNFIEARDFQSGQCQTEVRPHGSRFKFLPKVNLRPEFSNARITEQNG